MPVSLAPLPTGVPRYRDGFTLASSGVSVGFTDDWQRQHVLEDDGLCALLYQYLYKNIKGREDAMTSLRLPDTVVFDHNFPRAWYAYDHENDEITKRPGKMLDAQTMYSYFSLPTPGCDVVAQFVHKTIREADADVDAAAATTTAAPNTTTTTTATTAATNEPRRQRRLTYVEYFTADTLRTFLFQQRRKPDGVLQKFVLPRGSGSRRRNAQLHVLWSPVMTLVHSRVNRCCLDDTSASLATRCATYDGPGHLSEEALVADSTARRLERVCRDMAEHVYRTEKKRLTRMSVYGKVADDGKVWLLWCAGLRVAADALNPSYVRVPLAYDMRIEMLNEGLSSAAQLARRRERQRQLLLLDDALFAASHDLSFALGVNASHKRQAYALGLATPPAATTTTMATAHTAAAALSSSTSTSHAAPPQHPLNESFVLLYGSADVAERDVCGTRLSSTRQQQQQRARRHMARGRVSPHAGAGDVHDRDDSRHRAARHRRNGDTSKDTGDDDDMYSSSDDDDDDDVLRGGAYRDYDAVKKGAALDDEQTHPLRTHCEATMRPRDAVATTHAASADAMTVDAAMQTRVREELTALALDACYAVYSCMLTHPSHTRGGGGGGGGNKAAAAAAAAAMTGWGSVELAMPLVTALASDELRELTQLLSLQPVHETVDGGGGGGDATSPTVRYRIVRSAAEDSASGSSDSHGSHVGALLAQRPLACAERDVDAFFARVFAQRGDAVVRHVVEHYSEQLCLCA